MLLGAPAEEPLITLAGPQGMERSSLWPSVLFTGVPSIPLYPSFILPPPSVKDIDSRYQITAVSAIITQHPLAAGMGRKEGDSFSMGLLVQS